MGTRNLTMVIHQGVTKVAQYGQWDGYPDGQGKTVYNFLKNANLDTFKQKLTNCRFATKKDEKAVDKFLKSIGSTNGWMNMEQAEKFKAAYPYASRDLGADILNKILESEGEVVLTDSSDFATESLFCEWAYVIDLDANNLEVYTGFNKKPLVAGERFFGSGGKDGYAPIRLAKKYPINKLPTFAKFVSELTKKEKQLQDQ
jgi:hypothetical protein